MNRLRLLAEWAHLPVGSITYCHRENECASSAYELKENNASIKLRIPRSIGASSASLIFYNESLSDFLYRADGDWIGFEGGCDIYIFDFELSALSVGLYFFRPEIYVLGKKLFGRFYSHCVRFSDDPYLAGLFQLSIVDFSFQEPKDMYGTVIYHIFVDRFMRGGDRVVPKSAVDIPGDWKVIAEYPEYPGAPLKNNTFWGGTLWGIIDKLDYISSLGVGAIYLSPIFLSVSNHKYDTADYMTVDPIFGGEKALKALISECKNRGIKIILDGVFNHTGADSIYFNRYGTFDSVGAYQSCKSKYFDWYDFQEHPNKYTSWWDIEILPRINPDLPSCRSYFVGESGVISKYRKMGVYGMRLDVADELSDDFIANIKSVFSKDGESVIYGEVWEDASNKVAYGSRKTYYLGSELDGVMNYPLRTGIISYVKNRDTEPLSYALKTVMMNAPQRVMHAQMNLLGTHDTERILTIFGTSDTSSLDNATLASERLNKDERSLAIKRLKAAYTILATLPGVPAIFYGDEAGLEGYHDPFNRMPYPWGNESHELLEHYRSLGALRTKNQVYKRGEFKLITIERELLIFARVSSDYAYVTVMNNSDKDISLEFTSRASAQIHKKISLLHNLGALSAEVYKIKRAAEFEIF